MSIEKKSLIAVAKGDGIGPEIMDATLYILKATGAPLDFHYVEIGEKIYLKGIATGIEDATWEIIKKSKAFLKAPITTPQGGGFKSLNVTIRTTLGLYANVRPCVAYNPFIRTKHPGMDVTIIRENEEDLYTGIEYRSTMDYFHALKMITTPGSERIIRYAFEYARQQQRRKVTCFAKDNILKLTDGQFRKVFERIGADYPEIEKEFWIVDIGAAKLADTPEDFDVIVLPNLYGDILSDVAAQIAGSVGLAGSANIGTSCSMFEAIHGSAPRRAGQNVANPSGLILASVQMLLHLSLFDHATQVHNAFLKVIEDGIHTYDVFKEGVSRELVGTREFAEAIISRLGQEPSVLKKVRYLPHSVIVQNVAQNRKELEIQNSLPVVKKLVGIDLSIDWHASLDELVQVLQKLQNSHLKLTMISNRGVVVWPERHEETLCISLWRCRFMAVSKEDGIVFRDVLEAMHDIKEVHENITQLQCLFTYDGQPGYSLAPSEQ